MAQKWILEIIQNLGFKQTDAEVYLYLVTMGPQMSRSIALALRIQNQRLHRSLRNLQSGGIVKVSSESPPFFSAINIEEIVDSVINAKKEQALILQQTKEVLLSNWRVITNKDDKKCIPSDLDS